MEGITDCPSNGEEVTPEQTETTSPTDGEVAGKHGFHDDDYLVRPFGQLPLNNAPVKLYSAFEVQAEIRLTYNGTLLWIRKHVTPLGGTVRIGNRILVHGWALNEALKKLTWSGPKKGSGPKSGNLSKYVEGLKKRTPTQPRSKPRQ